MSDVSKLPWYQCHKKVRAAKITAVHVPGLDASPATLELAIPGSEKTELVGVKAEWLERFEPQVGGYLVVYDDGYRSFSPAQAFETGYSLLGVDERGSFVIRKLSLGQLERLVKLGIDAELQPDGLAKIYIQADG